MQERKWTEEETKFLIKNYEMMKTDDLMKVLVDKSNDQIRWKAKEFKLRKKVSKSRKDITWLEDITNPIHCYWWGFITADGCITNKQLILSISQSDSDHLKIFADKTNCKLTYSERINDWNPNGSKMCRVAINDCRTLERLINRFSIMNKKTYNPFDITEFLSKDNLCYFICGLIDGDGSIDKHEGYVSIKIHPNWKSKLDDIKDALNLNYGILSNIRITKDGWAILKITAKGCKILKKLATAESIPLMARKWDRVIIAS